MEVLQQSSSVLNTEIEYCPLPKQSLFNLSGAKYRLYIGAWRAGKSFAGCQEVLKQCIIYPNNCILIGRKDFTDLRDTTMKTFFEVVPEQWIKSYNKTEHHIVLLNDSEIYFRELKDGVGLGSLNLGGFYIDEAEEIEEQIFERLKGRLSLKTAGCRGWLTSNPPNEDHWIYRQFEMSGDPDYATFHASTYENRDNLPEGYIADLEKLPPSWRKKYLEGHYGFTPDGTPYYQGYIEHFHKRPLEYNPTLPLHCGWDSGFRHPAFVVTQWDGKVWKVLSEMLGSNTNVEQFVDTQVTPLLNNKYPNANLIHCAGPEFLQHNDKSDSTSAEILASKNIILNIRQSEYSLRKQLIEKKINTVIAGVPCLQVDTKCRIINDGFLGGYRYPTIKEGQAVGLNKEIPFKDGFYEHCMNAIEYIAVQLFKPIDIKPKHQDVPSLAFSNM